MKGKLHSAKMKTNFRRTVALVEGILPYPETPSTEQFNTKKETTKVELKACDLLCFFTADIIKEEVVFIR